MVNLRQPTYLKIINTIQKMEKRENNNTRSETEEFSCDICGEKFGTVSGLEEHKRRHGRPGLRLDDEQREMRGDIGAGSLPGSPII